VRNSLKEDSEGTKAERREEKRRQFMRLKKRGIENCCYSHSVLDSRREGLTTDDSDERSSELNDVRLDSSLGGSKDEVSNSSSSGFSLLVRSEVKRKDKSTKASVRAQERNEGRRKLTLQELQPTEWGRSTEHPWVSRIQGPRIQEQQSTRWRLGVGRRVPPARPWGWT